MMLSIESLSVKLEDTSRSFVQYPQSTEYLDQSIQQAENVRSQSPGDSLESSVQRDVNDGSLSNHGPVATLLTGQAQNYAMTDLAPPQLPRTRPQRALFHVATRSCGLDCECTCHKQSRIRSPSWIRPIIGSLFVGYSARPSIPQNCNSGSCRNRMARISYTYVFPLWFVKRAINASITKTNNPGSELRIRVMRVRAPGTEIFTLIASARFENDIVDVAKAIFSDGRASVADVTTDGLTILHVRSVKSWNNCKLIRSINIVGVALETLGTSGAFSAARLGHLLSRSSWQV